MVRCSQFENSIFVGECLDLALHAAREVMSICVLMQGFQQVIYPFGMPL
jgi:hypothetical protein